MHRTVSRFLLLSALCAASATCSTGASTEGPNAADASVDGGDAVGADATGGGPGASSDAGSSAPARIGYALGASAASSPAELDALMAHYETLGVDALWAVAAMESLCSTATCDFTPLDRVIARARARGWPVDLQVHGTPNWISSAGLWHGPATDTEVRQWTELFHQLVAHYGTDIAYYELWNEPDDAAFWAPSPSPRDYARLLHSVYLDAKAVNPAVQIVAPNTGRAALGYLDAMYDALAAYPDAAARHFFFDVLGMHPYAGDGGGGFDPSDAPGSHDITTPLGVSGWAFLDYRRMHDQVIKREGRAKDLVFGEFGYSTSSGAWFSVPEATRARYVASAYRLARQDGYIRSLAIYAHGTGDGFEIHGTATETSIATVAKEP
ncbi:hypothetical protein LVJ94_48150 [Pendulispora rubella]|uniref:Glycoside hydrolase family 5 domain-containing protein n=1 Tax=Pendulispora rubella TaxID=2741070 RepID=A0ABZ2L1G9_9BACT